MYIYKDRPYLWQLIDSHSGNRSEPFICTPDELKYRVDDKEDLDDAYVLCLMDAQAPDGISKQQAALSLPLFRLSSFVKISFKSQQEVVSDES